MRQKVSIQIAPSEAENYPVIKQALADEMSISQDAITGFHLLRKSLDARSRTIRYILHAEVFVNEPFLKAAPIQFNWQSVNQATQSVIIIGAGPAGLFAALQCLELGIKPIILERGKDVRSRRHDLAAINKQGIVNEESNYCFGEGGAGTYSDGKLYTRSNKRGNIERILNLFVQFGAVENILFESHPHIGTNKLPKIITNIRQHILACGGEIHFEQKVTDFLLKNDALVGVKTQNGVCWQADKYVLATGHSARDIFRLLHQKKIQIQAKPFALGVRIEHPQQIIDQVQFHCTTRPPSLPPASYSLVQQTSGRGVFTFCMCPGGIIAPASTTQQELVVNGWSPSKRNNPFANSGTVVEIRMADLECIRAEFKSVFEPEEATLQGALGLLGFQQFVERKSALAGGGYMKAPAQRMIDFVQQKTSSSLPPHSYIPGLTSQNLQSVLPEFVANTLREGIQVFGKKMKGYFTNEALLVATESRTSSPVRIPRLADTHEHIQIKNLYPCAEGAGYAGGIISAALDGENTIRKAFRL